MSSLDVLLSDPDIVRLSSALQTREQVQEEGEAGVRRAAVALIFRAGADGGPELLFIKRAEYPGDPWSGQVAFPGGREEPSDHELIQTAVRETREETGLDLAGEGKVLGMLDDLRPRTFALPAVIVRPYVVLLACRDEDLILSPEVALAFWIPLSALRNTESWADRRVFARGIQVNARAFQHEGHVIWGMTERIIGQLLSLIG